MASLPRVLFPHILLGNVAAVTFRALATSPFLSPLNFRYASTQSSLHASALLTLFPALSLVTRPHLVVGRSNGANTQGLQQSCANFFVIDRETFILTWRVCGKNVNSPRMVRLHRTHRRPVRRSEGPLGSHLGLVVSPSPS